jgi:hypothetical protein
MITNNISLKEMSITRPCLTFQQNMLFLFLWHHFLLVFFLPSFTIYYSVHSHLLPAKLQVLMTLRILPQARCLSYSVSKDVLHQACRFNY